MIRVAHFSDLHYGGKTLAEADRCFGNAVDRAIYELHIRDFSITDESVPENERGTYLAFTHKDSAGMTQLAEVADAGINTVHLLPSFDIATIEENRAQQAVPACDLASFAPDSAEQQACVAAVASRCCWGMPATGWSRISARWRR